MKKGQSVIEYVLLVAVTIITLLAASNFISKFKSNALEDHFQTARYYAGGIAPGSGD